MSELSYAERKQRPVLTGLLDYFPDACFEVAHCSFVCNEQHNPGQPMHWAKDKSVGEGNEIVRHLMDRKKHVRDTDGIRILAKAAWRALELLQREIEAERAKAKLEKLMRTPSVLEAPAAVHHAQAVREEEVARAHRYSAEAAELPPYPGKSAPVQHQPDTPQLRVPSRWQPDW